jgi:hypothetical protein
MTSTKRYESCVDRVMSLCHLLFFLFERMTMPIRLIAAMPLDLLIKIPSLEHYGIQNILNLLLFCLFNPVAESYGWLKQK